MYPLLYARQNAKHFITYLRTFRTMPIGQKREEIRVTFVPLVRKASKHIFSHIYQKQTAVVHVRDLNRQSNKISIKQNGIESSKIENFNDDTFSSLKNVNPWLTRKIFEYEVRKGHECFVGKKNDQPVFYVWTRKYQGADASPQKFKGYSVVSKKEIHFFSAFTKEDYRGKNIYPAGIQFLEDHYRKLGYERISCTTLKERSGKTSSQKGLAKIGFEETKKQITMTKFLFYKRYRRNFSVL